MSAAEPALPAGHHFELRQAPDDTWQFATLEYTEEQRVLVVELERSAARGGAWLAVDSSFCQWSEPADLVLEPEHTDRVLARLAAWCARTGIRIEVGPAVDPLVALAAEGYALTRNADGSVTAIPPPRRVRGLLAALFRR